MPRARDGHDPGVFPEPIYNVMLCEDSYEEFFPGFFVRYTLVPFMGNSNEMCWECTIQGLDPIINKVRTEIWHMLPISMVSLKGARESIRKEIERWPEICAFRARVKEPQ